MLIELRRVDAVWKSLHHEGPVRDGRQDERRDLCVVADQIALGQLEVRPEDLVQVADPEVEVSRERDHGLASGVLEKAQLLYQVPGSRFHVQGSQFPVRGSWFPVPGGRLLGRRTRRRTRTRTRTRTSTRTRTLNPEPGTWNLCDLLAPNVFSLLVIPQPEVDGMPQDIVGGPLSEANLCDELRLNPVGLLVRWRTAAERVFLDCQRFEERRQPG